MQYVTQPLEVYSAELRERGHRVVRVFGQGSVLVAAPAASLDALNALPFVRWAGRYHAVNKLEPSLVEALVDGGLRNPSMARRR